jgi:peptidoglycan/xylan/chitin deacetylase (PgdA/CDA1 family)
MAPLPSWIARAGLGAASVAAGALSAHLTSTPGSIAAAEPLDAPAATEAPPLEAETSAALADPSPALEAEAYPAPPAPGPARLDRSPAPSIELAASPPSPVRPDLGGGALITGASRQRILLFTFDDGPDARYTRRLLDMLDVRGVRAVFFLTAERFAGPSPWARENRTIVRDIASRGHVLASHGFRHVQFPLLSNAELLRELDAADAAFVDAIGLRPTLIRPPGGARSARTDALLASRGYTPVLWNLGTGDAHVRTADQVVETFRRVLAAREAESGSRGGIVLLHDIHPWSLEAFPRILDDLERRNCSLYARGEELYDVLDDPAPFVVPRAPGASPSEAAPWAELAPAEHESRQAALRERTAARCERLAMR